MTDPPPLGFAPLMMGLLLYVLFGLLSLAGAPPDVGPGSWPAAVVEVTSVVLAAVAVEALWTIRPWVTRAVAWFAAAVVVRLALGTSPFAGGQVGLLVFTAAALLLIVRYVNDRVTRIFAAGAPMARRP